jgi:rRNA maturation RNase YbeY
MAVDVSDSTGSAAAAGLVAAAERLLALLGREGSELSILLVDDAQMRRLNREWRGKDRPTDVLSFSQLEADAGPFGDEEEMPLGDVVISIDTARAQAQAGAWTLAEELNRLLLHGILHLLGYDHENGGEEERRMKAEELRLAGALVTSGHPCACDQGE